jgi:hypothetical protein
MPELRVIHGFGEANMEEYVIYMKMKIDQKENSK